jgi:hypothetical protein
MAHNLKNLKIKNAHYCLPSKITDFEKILRNRRSYVTRTITKELL